MCLEACPTYRVTGLETESPRGRIHLMQALVEGRREPTPDLTVHLDRCLACRACETACPSAVPYGRIIESTRAMLAARKRSRLAAIMRWAFAEPRRLRRLLSAVALYERSGLRRLLRGSGVTRWLPRRVRMWQGLTPPVRPRFSRESGGFVPARSATRARVGFLTGCVMRESYGDVHEAAVSLLARAGCEIVVPSGQVCCGALQAHGGDRPAAKELARRNVEAFSVAQVSAVVVDSAGCGAHMKHYDELLADEPRLADRARVVAQKTKDFSEVLLPLADQLRLGPLPLRVTYQDPCHLAHAQGIREAPRKLLAMVPGLELVEMREADRCCGSAGIYNLTQPDLSERVLDLKMVDVLETRPQAVVTANPGCMLQLRYGLERAGLDVPVYHLAEVLERSAAAAEPPR
jgi:glycolate oxidase iron-sulfur subunit